MKIQLVGKVEQESGGSLLSTRNIGKEDRKEDWHFFPAPFSKYSQVNWGKWSGKGDSFH